MKKGTTYQCDACHEVFTRTISDEEAMQEYKESPLFEPGNEKLGMVCDDCYQLLTAWVAHQTN